MPAPCEAICQETAWKNQEMRRFAVSLVRAALERAEKNPGEDSGFTSDLVADSLRGDGNGIAGSVITVLKAAHVIEPVGIVNDGVFFARRQASERPGAKCRWLNVYQLVSVPLAKSFLERNQLDPSAPAAAPVAVEQTLL